MRHPMRIFHVRSGQMTTVTRLGDCVLVAADQRLWSRCWKPLVRPGRHDSLINPRMQRITSRSVRLSNLGLLVCVEATTTRRGPWPALTGPAPSKRKPAELAPARQGREAQPITSPFLRRHRNACRSLQETN